MNYLASKNGGLNHGDEKIKITATSDDITKINPVTSKKWQIIGGLVTVETRNILESLRRRDPK